MQFELCGHVVINDSKLYSFTICAIYCTDILVLESIFEATNAAQLYMYASSMYTFTRFSILIILLFITSLLSGLEMSEITSHD